MAETATAPTPVTQEPTKVPPPVNAGQQGSAALAEGAKKAEPKAEDPYDFGELEIAGKKQALKIANKDQLKAILQKAIHADQVIKDGVQAKKGAEALMAKLKTPKGVREVLADPSIGIDLKTFALDLVREMMEDEQLTPEQRESKKAMKERDELKAWKEQQENEAKEKAQQAKTQAEAAQIRGQIIESMKKYPDIPQSQQTMDAVIQNMRAAFRRYGKHLTPDQAMTVYSQQYWANLGKVIESLPAEKIVEKFGQKTFDKIQKLKLEQLKEKTNPNKKDSPVSESSGKVKRNLTEKEYNKIFQQRMAGL